jgi:hypothetical protein
MKAKNYSETQRLIFEREITDKYYEGEMPVTETITERIIEQEPTVIERADEELRQAETEHKARSDPSTETEQVTNDYDEPADEKFWEDYERKINQEAPKSESPKSRPTIEEKVEGERPPELPEELKEEPAEVLEEIPTEDLGEVDIEIPETNINIDESDEIGSEIEWDIDIDYDTDQDPDYDY